MSQTKQNLMFVFALFSVSGGLAFADSNNSGNNGSGSGSSGYSQRLTNRENKRWTLQEWLEQRDRNRMMDLWLSMNSASPYEAAAGAAYKSYLTEIDTPKSAKSYTSADGFVTAHAHIIGITVQYENNAQESYNDLSGMLNLRLFGESLQSSYLAVHFGQRTRTYTGTVPGADYKNQFGQVSLQLYLMKYFGLEGFYRLYAPSTNDNLQQEMSGSLTEAGLFIDFKAVRIFGRYFRDFEMIHSTVSPFADTTTVRSGSKAGLTVFF